MKAFGEWEKCNKINYASISGGEICVHHQRYMAWKAAFENIQQWLMGRRCTGEDVLDYIYKELNNE